MGLALAIALALAPTSALAAGGSIALPAPADRANLPTNPTQLLGPDRPNEVINKAPGSIDDTEHVHVGIDATGKTVSVTVDQQLVLHGVGDFDLKIPGPALDVSAPPDEPNQPGLRRGSVIWAGFSGGTKTLTAHVVLNPDIEAFKLPFHVAVSSAGVRIENKTSIPVPVVDGKAEPAVLGRTVAAVRASLAAGGRPVAGLDGVPTSLPAASTTSTTTTTNVPVMAPFDVVGSVQPAGPAAASSFDAIVPGPQAPDGVLAVPATGHVLFTATPSPPDASSMDGTFRGLEVALWQVLRIDDVSAYLGNPFPGTSTTTYTYETVSATGPTPIVHAVQHAKPLAIGLALVAALGVVLLAGAVWLRS